MTTNSIILENMNSDSIKTLIKEAVREELAAIPPTSTESLISRKDAAKKLGICLVSLDKAVAKGILTGYRLNGRVLFKDREIDNALSKIPTRRHPVK